MLGALLLAAGAAVGASFACRSRVMRLIGGAPAEEGPKNGRLWRESRALGFRFPARREAFRELFGAFGARWARQNRNLGRSAAAQGAALIASLNCTWSCSRVERGAAVLEAHIVAAGSARHGMPAAANATATVLRFRVKQRSGLFEFAVCAGRYAPAAPPGDDWVPLIGFEGTSPKDGCGYKKVRTDRESLTRLCAAHAPALSFIDLAEMLASVPVVPTAWIDCVRAHVLEDAASEAAWAEGSSESQLASTSSLASDSARDSQAGEE